MRNAVPPIPSRHAGARSRRHRAHALLNAAALGLALVLVPASVCAQSWTGWPNRKPVPEPEYPVVTATPEWLAGRLDSRDVVVIDSRSTSAYGAGHVPGAVSFPPGSIPVVESPRDLERLADALGELGLTGRERLVCCGDVSFSQEAAGLFWLLEVAGATRVSVLDGGVAGWRAAGLELTHTESMLPPTEWAQESMPDLFATREFVRRSFGEDGIEILDARGSDAWRGPVARSDWGSPRRAGHIPHALPLDLTAFFAVDGTFLAPPETWRVFVKLGPRSANPVDSSDEFVVHGWGPGHEANSGVSLDARPGDGPLAYYLLRRAGVGRVRLYPGGWWDWSEDPYLPIVRVVAADELMQRLKESRRWLQPSAPPEDFAFFDVRHPADHTRAHIRGSVALRSDHFADSLDIKIERYWPDVDRSTTPVVTYCYGESCIRSRVTSTAAARGGFVHIERFYGGLDEWQAAGGKVVRGE